MERLSPHDEAQHGHLARVLGSMAERGAWRLRTQSHAQGAVLDTVLGRIESHDAALHEALVALSQSREGAWLPDIPGAVVRRCGVEVCIETLPPLLQDGSRALVTAGTQSAQAFALVDAALRSGRNVLCAGPYTALWPSMAAWLDAAREPAALPTVGPAGKRWRTVDSADDAVCWGADRIGCWGLKPKTLSRTLSRLSGAIGHLEAHGLERALMRFEHAVGAAGAPLAVLASVDVVVCGTLDGDGRPLIEGIYEIVMADTSYQPRSLFVRQREAHGKGFGPLMVAGMPSFSAAIAPYAEPGLLDALTASVGAAPAGGHAERDATALHVAQTLGHGELERRVAAHAAHAPPNAQGPFKAQAAMMLATPKARAGAARRAESTRRTAAPAAPRRAPLSPGWELEQLADLDGPLPFPEDEPTQSSSDGDNVDAAALAATFGLAPPQAPRGLGADVPTAMGPRPTAEGGQSFLEALAKSSRSPSVGDDTFVGPSHSSGERGSSTFDDTTVSHLSDRSAPLGDVEPPSELERNGRKDG